jgi:hypothetical protein
LQCSNVPGKAKAVWYGDLCLANPANLPAAIVRLQVKLRWDGQWLDGQLVLEKKDDVPWTVEPMRVLSRSLGFAFQVEETTAREKLVGPQRLRLLLTTVDGRTRVEEITTCSPAPALAA